MIRYAYSRIIKQREPLNLGLRSGIKFWLRPDTSENNDYGVAYEIFIHQYYRPPADVRPDDVRVVVDLGGNVGLSILYWLNVFPRCSVLTFEPNPLQVAQMMRNIALSGQSDRVVIHARAAGARERTLRFSNQGTSSSALHTAADMFEAEMADIFKYLPKARIDLLKLDVEGGEYEILADPRFELLDIGLIVMEWHSRGHADTDRHWCERRLAGLGFTIQTLFTAADHGMFWARKSQQKQSGVLAAS